MAKKALAFLPLFLFFLSDLAQKKSIDQRVDSVLHMMTLEEKIGQMNQYNGDFAATGPITKEGDKQDQIRKGMLGSMLNIMGVDHTRTLQEIAMQLSLKIPLLFGQDVIHGYRTIFPIPLAEAASWDLDAIRQSARVAATEASAAGIHWTFAPMVDIASDPRWGRVMEGTGEDTYLGSQIATARVNGFQGNGLFDDPFKFCNDEREKKQWNNAEHLKIEKAMAEKSIVLLKNEKQLLPLSKQTKTLALIGPFIKAKADNNGFWSYDWTDDSIRIVSTYDGVKNAVSVDTKLLYAKGCNINDNNTDGFAEAIEAATQADVVVMQIGEARDMTGEAKSRSNLHLPGVQEELIKAIQATGKPVVVMINAGRPLIFNWTADNVPAILYTWWLGTEAGTAIADVLFGDYNPSAKLPISFPVAEGQIPIYYNHYNTGRPAQNDNNRFYRSAYTDLSIYPKFPFGYGLSYTQFTYSDIKVNKQTLTENDKLEASVTLTNRGNFDGTETV